MSDAVRSLGAGFRLHRYIPRLRRVVLPAGLAVQFIAYAIPVYQEVAAHTRANGKVVLQGGIPSVLVCDEGCTADEFERYVEETILPLRGRRGFILGMSDNVPPNADFARVERIAELIA